MRPVEVTISPTAADPDGICQSQTPAAGGSQELTINGALATGGVATLSPAGHVSITSAGDDSGRTFIVEGTDRTGGTQIEIITGPDTTTVASTKNFATVTSVTVDDDTAGAITVGSADSLDSAWVPLDWRAAGFDASLDVTISSTADFTYGVEYTHDNLLNDGEQFAVAWPHATVTSETTAQAGTIDFPVTGVRLAITSFVAGSAVLRVVQTG